MINMQVKVASKASRKPMAVRTLSLSTALANTLSKTAKEIIKTISGNKKARITLSVTDAPEAPPIFS